ncbi:MAG: dockerin type I domain-containing protein, partial [Oscillospiraceae bacterium]|nr:dockerin type I domain-containing protein [Oscillospiraceae bacterium]
SEDDWSAIEFGEHNEYLTSATIHYNSADPDDTGDTEDTDLMRGDINGDGVIDAADLTLLARYVGKIISSLD